MESLLKDTVKNSRIPARLDFLQSGTGLILGLFMWVHMFLICSIIFGPDVFNFVAGMMEAKFLSASGHGYPILVVLAVAGVSTIFVVHAALAIRKFPHDYNQYKILRQHVKMMNHSDTNLWFIQFITGFAMFFLGSVHLVIIMTNPEISSALSAGRVYGNMMWPFYALLLICVELHGTIGLYRLCVKWDWFVGKNAKAGRKRLKMLKHALSVFFIVVGFLALYAFFKVGYDAKPSVSQTNNVTIQQNIEGA
jgi:fumarate reductase subunit C